MIEVLLHKGDNLRRIESYPLGAHAIPDENGWISILDEDGLVLGMHPKEHVVSVTMKAGESTMKSENPV